MKTTMLKSMMVFSFLGLSHFACSQVLSGGITAGATFNRVELDQTMGHISSRENMNGFEAGLFVTANFGGLYVRPMAVASFMKGTVKTMALEGTQSEDDFELTTLEVPAMVGLQLLPVISVEAGPTWNYLMHYSDQLNGVALNLNRHSLGYRAGVRLRFSKLGLFGHYGGIISEQSDDQFRLSRPSRIVVGATLDFGAD
jgi:hypothetical protein